MNLKKAVIYPNKKESSGWFAFNFTLLSRFALYSYASVSLFCDCMEMKINSKGAISPWMMKGFGLRMKDFYIFLTNVFFRVKEDFFLPPPEYASSYKLFFSQFIKTQLAPAIKGTVKIKKLMTELYAVAERLASLLLHTVQAHSDKLKRLGKLLFEQEILKNNMLLTQDVRVGAAFPATSKLRILFSH